MCAICLSTLLGFRSQTRLVTLVTCRAPGGATVTPPFPLLFRHSDDIKLSALRRKSVPIYDRVNYVGGMFRGKYVALSWEVHVSLPGLISRFDNSLFISIVHFHPSFPLCSFFSFVSLSS